MSSKHGGPASSRGGESASMNAPNEYLAETRLTVPDAEGISGSDEDADEILLNWDNYRPRYHCCGADCTALIECLPCCPWAPPEFWYQLSRRQRRLAVVMGIVVVALIVLVALTVILKLLQGSEEPQIEDA